MINKFQGKWVYDVMAKRYGGDTNSLLDVQRMLDRVDVLLQIAALETDNEFLHDDIEKLLKEGFTQ
jgi:hypothetical protein